MNDNILRAKNAVLAKMLVEDCLALSLEIDDGVLFSRQKTSRILPILIVVVLGLLMLGLAVAVEQLWLDNVCYI